MTQSPVNLDRDYIAPALAALRNDRVGVEELLGHLDETEAKTLALQCACFAAQLCRSYLPVPQEVGAERVLQALALILAAREA